MRRNLPIIFFSVFIFGAAAFLYANGASVHAQQTNPTNFIQTYEAAVAKARQACATLWSDHIYDALRTKIPLGEEKPTFPMLTSAERLHPKDKSVADSAIKTVEQCRAAYAPVYAMLPSQVTAMIQGVQRQQDAVIAELYRRKITFGDFNVAMNRLNGALAGALSGIPTSSQSAPVATQPPEKNAVAQLKIPPPRPQPEQHDKSSVALSNEIRLALVIGNSNYVYLPKLSNPANDARAITEILKKLGYKTRLLLDASEQNIRREVRQFASDSDKADVALVFFAGHGAQVNGNNYLLPIDIDIPRTEVDIQFTGLKVDDLVNSIRSNTKIVFLDACRDNPALFKNIVRGRGSPPVGLAPATASNFEPKPGGGVFIAYATDAGSVADDGKGQHSPFTQALLRNIQKPISIDDMFSLVTREVRLVTKNAQRPYKYASLENIVCVTPACSNSPAPATSDVIQQAKQSESEELQIALQTKNVDALETYLQKYPDALKRTEVLSALARLRESEFKEWSLFAVGDKKFPHYLKFSSIQRFGEDRAAALTRTLESSPSVESIPGKQPPDPLLVETTFVYDCKRRVFMQAERTVLNKSGETLNHYKWGNPRLLNLSLGTKINPGSVAAAARNILCYDATPLVGKKQLSAMNFKSLSSTVSGDGEIFYEIIQNTTDAQNEKLVLFIIKFHQDHNVIDLLESGTSIPDPPNYRTVVHRAKAKCDENKWSIVKNEYYDSSNNLVYLQVSDPSIDNQWNVFVEGSPISMLQNVACEKEFAGIGVQVTIEDGAVKVAKVIDGTPAARAGIIANDIITHLDSQSLSGFTLDQVIKKMRGSVNTEVNLKLLRSGQGSPIEVIVTREMIRMQSALEQVKK